MDTKRFIVLTLNILLLLVTGMVPSVSADVTPSEADKKTSTILVNRGWQYRWDDSPVDAQGTPEWTKGGNNSQWKDLSTYPVEPPGRGGHEYLWLRVRLPRIDCSSPALYFSLVVTSCEIYFNKKTLYSFGNPSTGRFGGIKFHLVDLPDNYHREYCYFRFHSRVFYIGLRDNIYLGSRGGIIAALYRKEMDKFIIGFIILFIGIVSLIIFARLRRFPAYFYFGAGAIFAGLYTVRYTAIKEFHFPGPLFWLYAWVFALVFFPLFLTGFYYHIFEESLQGRWKTFLRRFYRAHFAVSSLGMIVIISDMTVRAFTMAIDTVPILVFMRFTIHVVLLVDLTVLVTYTVRFVMWRNRKALVFMAGMLFVAAFSLHDIIKGIMMMVRNFDTIVYWGAFGFIVTNVYVLALYFKEMSDMLLKIRDELSITRRIHESIIEDSIIMLNPSFRVVMINVKTEELTSASLDQLREHGLSRVIDEYDSLRDEIQRMMDQNILTFSSQFHFISGGHRILIDAQISKVMDEQETLNGILIRGREVKGGRQLKEEFGITEREFEVILLVVMGHSNRIIAQSLGIAERTVKTHITNIYNKLTVNNKIELFNLVKEYNISASMVRDAAGHSVQ
jgi:DNA-binding NarL/FixJ family response regulator